MTVDISKVFKANVKALRINSGDDKAKVDALNEQLLSNKKLRKEKGNEIKSVTKQVVYEANNIVKNVTILKEFLLENKKSYVQPNYLLNQQSDDTDWQNYEDQAESIIKKSADSIKQLKEKTLKNNLSTQLREHFVNVFFLLEKYLKDVCKIYSEQKAIRIKRIIEIKSHSQLYSQEQSGKNTIKPDVTKVNFDPSIEASNVSYNSIEKELSPIELQTFENENVLLYEDLNSQIQEVKQIESQVIEVSKLTQIFAENIVSQLSTIESVQKSAFETNSNLNLGNEHIKEAMKKGAALRLWILFVIVVLSFTLLFLDWYND